MHFRQIAAIAASISIASASIRGFNTGNLMIDGTSKQQSDFAAEFTNQRKLQGTDGAFTAARLYTMIQGGTDNGIISAIPAAIASNTQLLLGLWASAGQDSFDQELTALDSAIKMYGSSLAKLVTGISVGSEDLYRVSPTGIENNSGIGAGPATIATYIGEVRKLIAGTALSAAPVGHVDTWTAWVNGSNSACIDACDFIGMNSFPYFETTVNNPASAGGDLFYQSLDVTKAAVGGKPVWVTETGYPTTGPNSGEAVASTQNARSYWEQVYCTFPSDVELYWYEQRDSNAADAASFGVTGSGLSTTPLYDLSCDDIKSSSSSVAASSTKVAATATGAGAKAAATTSAGTSGTGSVSSGSGSGSSGSGSAGSGNSGVVVGGSSGNSGSGSGSKSGSGSGSSVSSATTARYPTASVGGSGTGAVAATGTGSVAAASSTLTAFNANGASNIRGTLALLAIPALLALML